MNLLVVDGEPRGHYLVLHFRIILREALKRGWKVHLLTTQRALDHNLFELINAEFAGQYTTSLMEDIVNSEAYPNWKKIIQHFQRWFAMRDGFRKVPAEFKTDLVYQVAFEKSDLPMAVLGSPFGKTPFTGLLMNRYFHAPTMGLDIGELSFRDRNMAHAYKRVLAIPTLRKLLNIDPLLTEYCKKMGWKGAEKGVYVPDTGAYTPYPHIENPRALLGVPEGKFLLVNYGALTPRKGVAEMIEALGHPDCPSDVIGLIAGRSDAGAKDALVGPTAQRLVAEGRLVIHDRFMTEDEEAAAFQACDLAWLGYIWFYGMSSVLIHSGSVHKPVITQDKGLCAYWVDESNTGYVVNVFDAGATARVLARAYENPAELKEKGENNFKFSQNHASVLFGQRVCDALESGLKG